MSRRIADEAILIPVQRKVEQIESLYTLNEVAARIWDLIDGERPLVAIRDAIVAEFDVDGDTAETHLLTLIEQFGQIGAVQEVSGS